MWNPPTKIQLNKLPKLYSTGNVKLNDKIISMHFFIGNCDWYIVEFDGTDLFFGYANLGDSQNAEWGYISLSELLNISIHGIEVDRDLHWNRCKFSDIV